MGWKLTLLAVALGIFLALIAKHAISPIEAQDIAIFWRMFA